MSRFLACALLAALCTGCVNHQGWVPMQNQSMAEFSQKNFEVVGTGVRGESSVLYLLQLFPTSDPTVATEAMNQLVNSAGTMGTSRALANFSADVVEANYILWKVLTVSVRADVVEFR